MQQDVSPLTSDRISLSSEPLNHGGALAGSGSSPISHLYQFDDVANIYNQFLLNYEQLY